MFRVLLILVLLSSCGGNSNVIRKRDLAEFNAANKAIVVLQTTPIINKPGSKKIEMEWLNIDHPKEFLHTKNYMYLYGSDFYNCHKTELYSVKPGNYVLQEIKHLSNGSELSIYNRKNRNIRFSIKGGEVLYIGNIVINLANKKQRHFFERSFSIIDDYDLAKTYLDAKYPDLSSRVQNRLIRLH